MAEEQYSPSRWVVRVQPDMVVPLHLEEVTKASVAAREEVPHLLDLQYGKRKGQYLDLYGTDLPKGSSMFVYIHGGLWQMLSKDSSAYPVVPLWRAGVKSVVVDYDLVPSVKLDIIVEEIREMAVFILNMAKENGSKDVWFGGHSAGAHLAASLLEPEWFNSLEPSLRQLIRGVVLISGIFDLSPIIQTSENMVLQLTLTTALEQSPMFKQGKVEMLGELTALLVVAEHDSPAFHNQSEKYSEELQYNPTCWVTRVPRESALPQYINISNKTANLAREKVPHRLNLRYGVRKGQLLDLYGTDLPKGAPIFVFLHGGYWQLLSKDISANPVIPLRIAGIKSAIVGYDLAPNGAPIFVFLHGGYWQLLSKDISANPVIPLRIAGIKSAIVGYDLAPNVTLDVIVQEIREMAVFILNTAREEKTKDVWFGGHSAGAHLVASLLEPEWFNSLELGLRELIRGVVLISGIFDVPPLIETSFNKKIRLTLETAIRQSPMFKYGELKLLRSFSALLAFARQDAPSFHGQSIEYRKVIEMKSSQIKTKLIEIKGETDHYNLVTNLQYSNYVLTKEIIRLIKNGL